jgi:5'-methylthioadenosine phosphorylase
VELILENLRSNIHNAKAVIKNALASLPSRREAECGCGDALKNTIVTAARLIPPEVKERLRFIIGKYVPPEKGKIS